MRKEAHVPRDNTKDGSNTNAENRGNETDLEYEPEKKKHFHLSFGTIRNIGCLLLLALLAFGIYVVVVRPPEITASIKHWLNAGVEMPEDKEYSLETVLADLSSQANSFTVGNNELVLSEDALRALAKDRLSNFNLNGLNLDITGERLNIYWELTTGSAENIIGIVGFKVKDQNITLDYLGVPRIAVPPFLYPALQNSFLKLLSMSSNESFSNIIGVLLPGVNVVGASIQEDTLKLIVQVSSGLEV